MFVQTVSALDAVALGLTVISIVCADLRWLRVAQREHYLAGAAARFAWRWWSSTALNLSLVLLAAAGAVGAAFAPASVIVTAGVVAAAPLGLGLKGRTSRLSWTRRLALAAGLGAALETLAVALAGAFGGLLGAVVAAGLVAIATPVLLDAALFVLRPVEDMLAQRYVRRAVDRLEQFRPLVVGITGSYGKTTTKNYVAYLLAGEYSVVASPRSFNNRAGLSRTVNDHLVAGTDVLVAEMGAYGPGEIAALCAWLRPEIAVITSVGQSHLERFGNLERTLEAKAEITAGARVAILNVDDARLAGLAKRLEGAHKVLRISGTDANADVAVLANEVGLELYVGGKLWGVAPLKAESHTPIRTNAACAAAVALELGVAPAVVLARLGSLPGVPNRLQRYYAEGGYLVLDDTFNANPAGARHALEVLACAAPTGRRMLVTPGIVELGRAQRAENAAFAEQAAQSATDVVIVARTNRSALLEGSQRVARPPVVKLVAKREQAVEWARAELGPDDAVLFENDLPDHFP
ncbi:MAG: UDP-N-acetylmuramoyl-tripeptide--D-alanyl-D-alanine ligase [Acidimicrobiales bacterium]